MPSTSEINNRLYNNLATKTLMYHSKNAHLEDGSLAFDISNSSNKIPYNEVFLIDKIDSPVIFIDFENQKEAFQVTSKNLALEDNLFILADAKQNLSSEHFCLVFEKYLGFVIDVMKTCDFAFINFKFDFKNEISEDILTAFEIQLCSIINHFNELLSRYNIKIIDDHLNSSKKSNNKTHMPQNLNSETSHTDIKPKTLATYILHEKNEEIEKIIIESFKEEKGKSIRYMIEYLVQHSLVTLEYGKKRKLFNAMEISFKRKIGAYNSIWGFENNIILNDPDYKFTETILNTALKKILLK